MVNIMIKRSTLILVLTIAAVLSTCLCSCGSYQKSSVSSEKSEAVVSSKISSSPIVDPTPKPTVKPSAEPTAEPTTKAISKPTTKATITPTTKPDEFAGEVYANCPTCSTKIMINGPVTGALAWVNCKNCGNYFVGVNEPRYGCMFCGRSKLYPEDMSKDISYKCKDCAESIVTCVECGKSVPRENVDSSAKICIDCMSRHTQEHYNNLMCAVCGRNAQEVSIFYEDNDYALCEDCYAEKYISKKYYCSDCSKEIAEEESSRGLCSDCFSQPNVWCPSCGFGFFTTGVGTDGITCKNCEHNWLP